MKKILSLGLLQMVVALSASGAPITPEQALKRMEGILPTRAMGEGALQLVQTTPLSDGQAGLYIYNRGTESGYLILSADDCAAPILGYSDSGSFNIKSMSPQMNWWLEEYGRQIEYARMTGAPQYVSAGTRAERSSISPLLQTKWNQGSPYDGMTPEVDGRHCVTGCVATAMAQVMKHWNYPESGTGTGTCTVTYDDGTTAQFSMNLGESKFDWQNMLNVYDGNSSAEENDAVAYLMKACGYATGMKYTSNMSGTSSMSIGEALVKNFGYNPNIQFCMREYYLASDWNEMIYEELKEGRPVVYSGQSMEGGHAFVCDGYSQDGYFHFNWGWGGMSDGYFLLNALNPDSLGIGANGGGYNFDQSIVRGIQPTRGTQYPPIFAQQGNMTASIKGNAITLSSSDSQGGWFNLSTTPINIDLGVKYEPTSFSGEAIYKELGSSYTNQTLEVGYGWASIQVIASTSLQDGTYRMTLCYRIAGTSEWIPVLAESDCYNSIELTKKGTRFSVKKNPSATPEIVDAEFLTPLYYGEATKMSITVANPSDKEITESFYPALYSGGFPAMIADGLTITLAPGETVTREFICIFSTLGGVNPPTQDTTYSLYFFNPASPSNTSSRLDFYQWDAKTVTMMIDSGEYDISFREFSMPDLATTEIDGGSFYVVEDPNEVTFFCEIVNNGNYFAKPIALYIFPYVKGQQVYNVDYCQLTPVPLLMKNEEAKLSATITFSVGEPGKSYFAIPAIDGELISNVRVYFTLPDNAAVDGIEADNEPISVAIYSLNGQLISRSTSAHGNLSAGNRSNLFASIYDDLPSGIFIVKTTLSDGTVKTEKIIR